MTTSTAAIPRSASVDAHAGLRFDAEREIAGVTAWLAERLAATGRAGFVLGLSGGLDSAVVAELAIRAVGPERVTLVSMPYGLWARGDFPASARASYSDAAAVAARHPRATFRLVDIAPAVDAMAAMNGLAATTTPATALALGNVKARVRMIQLYYLANLEQGLVLGTENYDEHVLGYATLHGDAASDIEPILAYTKSEVRALAAALGVPEAIQTKAPSADLFPGHADETELGFTYVEADRVLTPLRDAGLGGPFGDTLAHLPPATVIQALEAADVDATASTTRAVLARVAATTWKRDAKPAYAGARAARTTTAITTL